MSYFIVKLGAVPTSVNMKENELLLDMDEYLQFIQLAREKGAIDEILKAIDFGCVKCKSFTIPSVQLYDAIESTDNYDLEGIEELKHRLLDHIILTDEEWSKYWEKGQDSVEGIKGKKIVGMDEDIYCFRTDEVFFQFNDTCECSKIIRVDAITTSEFTMGLDE